MSLFERIEEFSLQEDTFGVLNLQEDLLDADLDGALGGVLNFDLGQDGGLKLPQSIQTSLESLVMPGTTEEFFGEDWMETVDLSSLLNGNQEVPPVIEVTEPEPEPRKEGLKPSAFELLKQLLTCPVPDQKVEIIQPDDSLPSSPEQQVVDFQLLSAPVEESNFEILEGDEVSGNCLEDLIELKAIECESVQQNICVDSNKIDLESWSSPQSIQSNTSFISEPSSPESVSFQTIDSSHLDSSDSFSQVSENDFTELKAVSKRSRRDSKRTTPYKNTPVDKGSRKKVQNKNAATRYRVKKRIEKVSLQEQEGQLSDRNKELREKVESLQREISYMKELMTEIQKAKQKKI